MTNLGVNFPSPPELSPSTTFQLGTSSFVPGHKIPDIYTCDSANTPPALAWIGRPARTQSFVLTMETAKQVRGRSIRWIVYNIPASSTGLLEGTPESEELAGGARQGLNDLGKIGYRGPCPPRGTTHHYIFKLYALDTRLPPRPKATARDIMQALKDHILGQAEITGTYSRQTVAGR